MQRIRKAVIPAAGFGTRFLPATKAQPKEMLPIVDTPAIQYIVKEALDSGIEEILIITGRNKRAIEDHFDSSVELELLLQSQGKNKQLAMIKDLADIKVHFYSSKKHLAVLVMLYCVLKHLLVMNHLQYYLVMILFIPRKSMFKAIN